MNLKIFALLVLAAVLSSCATKQAVKQEGADAVIQEEKLKLPDVTAGKDKPEEKQGEAKPAEKKAEERYVMLNFENADIETVIATIGEMLKINYILMPGVSGKITIQSHNKIPLSELFSTFQTALEFNGFTAVKDGSFYRIVPIDTAKQQPVHVGAGKQPEVPKDSSFITQEIPVAHVKAGDVANVVRNLMPRGTDIVVYEPTNKLIVTAPPAGIVKFLKILDSIDVPAADQESVKTFVYNVENGEAKKLVELLKNIYGIKQKQPSPSVKSVSPAAPATPAAPTPATGRTPARPAAPVGASVSEGLAADLEGDVQLEAYEDINAILIKATPKGYLALLETLRRLDVQPKQVLIEVLIAEITLDNRTQFGIEWLLKASVRPTDRDYDMNILGGFTGSNTGSLIFDTVKNAFVPPTSGGGSGTGTDTGTDSGTGATGSSIFTKPADVFASVIAPKSFGVLLTAAAATGRLNVLASPHILALDNKEAKIEIADEVPVATSITQPNANTGSNFVINNTSQVQFKSAGTILTVTPHINEKKQVTLKLTQEVSELGKNVKIGGQDYQGFTTRKATTSAIVQDGHTLIIGGIINERKSQSRSGLPFLSDLPLVGYLFGTTTDEILRKELILMVTPRVISNYEEADELTRELKNRVRGIKEKIQKRERELDEKDPDKQ